MLIASGYPECVQHSSWNLLDRKDGENFESFEY